MKHKIENDYLQVIFDDSSGTFSAVEQITGKLFLTDGRLEEVRETVKVDSVQDPVFGSGMRILLQSSDGSENSLELYPKLPFLLIRGTLRNAGKDLLDITKRVPAIFNIELDAPVSQLQTMGTGGLLAPGENPGSYFFLTCADPATRRGVVAGWLSSDRGAGVLFSQIKDGKVEFKAQIDYGHLRIPAGRTARLESLAIGCFGDARIGQERLADAVARYYRIKLRPRTGVYCTWYAEEHGGAGDEFSTIELADFVARELKPFGLTVIQIDDRWQDGPELDGPTRGFERCRPGGPYPNGMEPVTKALDKLGLTFGLWWLPFGRNHAAPDYADRQHWFARWSSGDVMKTKAFGGTCLDLTHPEVRDHLAMLSNLFRSWGIKYYKMDGLWTGTATELTYINDGYIDDKMGNVSPFHDPLKTQIEAYRDGLHLLRDNAGDDVFFSGCCVSQNMRSFYAFGLVDSMRIGPDFNHDGQGLRTGALRGSRLYFMNGRIWWNDPDPTMVRARSGTGADPACSNGVTMEQAQLATSWVSLSGQFYLSSDWLPALPAERIEIMKRTLASHSATARPVDYFDHPLANTWLVTDDSNGIRRNVIGLFNFHEEPLNIDYTCEKIGLDAEKNYHAFDFWANRMMPDFRGLIRDEVPPNSCRVIAVRADEGHPVILSTSRHVTQGIIDVRDEKWDGRKNCLSAVSRVIANDPYEIRVAGLADGGRRWDAVKAVIADADIAAGVGVSLEKSSELLRVTIKSPTTRDMAWHIDFTA